MPKPITQDLITKAILVANDIAKNETRALELEFALEAALDKLPLIYGPENQVRVMLSELADTYQHLFHTYKELAEV